MLCGESIQAFKQTGIRACTQVSQKPQADQAEHLPRRDGEQQACGTYLKHVLLLRCQQDQNSSKGDNEAMQVLLIYSGSPKRASVPRRSVP